jgi:AcrR family transcriptional regulator
MNSASESRVRPRESVRRILEAAALLWSRHGLHGVSLERIAAEAGVAKSLLHYHFDSKEHLLLEVNSYRAQRLFESVRLEAAPPAAPAKERIAHYLQSAWGLLVEQRDQVPLQVELWRASRTNPRLREHLDAFAAGVRALLHAGLADVLGATGDAAARLADMAALINVILEGFVFHLYQTDDVAGTRPAFEELERLLVRVLAPAATPTEERR